MANEFKHKDPGATITQAEYIASDGTGHIFDSQASGDILYASSTTVLARLAKATDGNVLELASGLPAWTASPTIGSTNWANANHAHAASNSGGTLTTLGTITTGVWQGTAIASAYIAADAITGAKVADNAIDSEHYTDGSIDNAHLADDAVDSDEIAAGAIDTAHIADNQVTLAKMAGITRGSIIYGDTSGDPAALVKGSANYVLTSDGTDIAWAAAAGGPDQAVQSDIEAETNENTYIPPDLVKHSPGVAKAWVSITAAGANESPTYNVDATTDTGTGDRQINFTTDFSTNVYICISSLIVDGGAHDSFDTRAVGSVQHTTRATSESQSDRATTCAFYGDQ